MRLVDEREEVGREVIEERPGPASRGPAGKVSRVVLDPVAGPGLAEHLEVEVRALPEALRLEEAALVLELGNALHELRLDVLDCLEQLLAWRDEVTRRVDVDAVAVREDLTRERVELGDALHVVAEELDPQGEVLVRGLDLEGVAAHAELPADQIRISTFVLDVDEVAEHRVAPDALALVQPDRDGAVVDRRAEAVDARDRGNDDHVASLEERAGRGVAHLVDLLVPRGVLLDVGVAPRDVRLGLVVVVVRDEVLDRAAGEELLELPVKLRRQRLVVGEHQRGPAGLGDDLGHRHRLAGARDAAQRDVPIAGGETVDQPGRGRWLVSREVPRKRQTERRSSARSFDRDLEGLASRHGVPSF